MKTDQELKKLIDEVFPNKSGNEKNKLFDLLSIDSRVEQFKDIISIQENMLDITEPLAVHGNKFKGGERGQGKKAQEWKEELYILSQGLEGDRLNFSILLERIKNAINNKNSDFWYEINQDEELVFFNDGLDSIKFKSIKNEITNMRKKTHHKAK